MNVWLPVGSVIEAEYVTPVVGVPDTAVMAWAVPSTFTSTTVAASGPLYTVVNLNTVEVEPDAGLTLELARVMGLTDTASSVKTLKAGVVPSLNTN